MATRKFSVIDEVIYLICPCSQKHRLIPGIAKPNYWCGDILKELQEGDIVDILEDKQREDTTDES